MKRTRSFVFGCLMLALAWPAVGRSAPATNIPDRVVTLEGNTVELAVDAISEQGVLSDASGRTRLALRNIRSIERPGVAARQPPPAVTAWLADGSTLAAEAIRIEKQTCALRRADAATWTLALNALSALRFAPRPGDPPESEAAFAQALKAPAEAEDTLLLRSDSGIQKLRGAVEGASEDALAFNWNGQVQTVRPDRIVAVVFTRSEKPPAARRACRLCLNDGSRIWARDLRLEGARLSFKFADAAGATVQWSGVSRLDVLSDRVRYLSDLDPVRVEEQAWVTAPLPWQRDANVMGGALTVAGKTFSKGLGTHAETRLTFACDSNFPVFSAMVGIDDCATPDGDCEFALYADGRQLIRERAKRGEPARLLRAKLDGVRELTLAAEPGANLDLSDHANWCEARFEAPATEGGTP